jgi:hypothetical protein
MPHRVTNFLRSSSGNIHHTKKTVTNRHAGSQSSSSSSNGSNNSSRATSRATSPDSSDREDRDSHSHHHHHHHSHIKMPDLADAVLKSHRRISLPFVKRESHNHSSSQTAPAAVDWSIESPPIVFHGSAEDSTGALLSGQLVLDVRDEVVEVDSFVANLRLHVTHKRPFQNHCHDCQHQYTDLKDWRFVAAAATHQPMTLRRGRHLFPFSTLLDGHLPASVDTTLMTIGYEFKAEARLAGGHVARFERGIEVKRSLPEPDTPHHSVRLFPPTNIKSSAHYASVIHPTASNTVTVKLDGLMVRNDRSKTLDMWKLKKFTWKLQETVKTVAPACDKHAPAAAAAAATAAAANGEQVDEAARKGVARAESRILGEKQIHEGWKSDYSGVDGTVDLEFDYFVQRRKGQLRYACDGKSADGTEVAHTLLIELVVSREFAPEGKPHLSTQTGAGRILRMHYNVVMTEHAGLGISWDEEAPPVYQDVPPSPPGYCIPEQPIEYEELEFLDARRASDAGGSPRAPST